MSATHCKTLLQHTLLHTATCCNTQGHCCNALCYTLQDAATHCKTLLQHTLLYTATCCNTLQHAATHTDTACPGVIIAVCCSVLQCVAVCCSVLQGVAVYNNVCCSVCCSSVLQCEMEQCDAVCGKTIITNDSATHYSKLQLTPQRTAATHTATRCNTQ